MGSRLQVLERFYCTKVLCVKNLFSVSNENVAIKKTKAMGSVCCYIGFSGKQNSAANIHQVIYDCYRS